MTIEQRYDRLERMARLLYEAATRSARQSRRQTKKLKAYLEAQKAYEAIALAEKARTGNSNTSSALVKARRALDQARENLKR